MSTTCSSCNLHQAQAQGDLGLKGEREMERSADLSGRAPPSSPRLAVSQGKVAGMKGRLRRAASQFLAGIGRRVRSRARRPGQQHDVVSRLMQSGVFGEAEREALEGHLSRLSPIYTESCSSAPLVKEHMLLLEKAAQLKDGFAALALQVKEADRSAADVSTSDSSGSYSTLQMDDGQMCMADISFACGTHVCRPVLASAMKQAGFSLVSLTIFDVLPRGSLGTIVARVCQDDCSQQVLEQVFSSALDGKSKRWSPLGSSSRRSSSDFTVGNILKSESERQSSRGRTGFGSRILSPALSPIWSNRSTRTTAAGDVECLLQALSHGDKRMKSRHADVSKFVLDPLRLEMGQLIATGASGEVQKGILDGREVAVKVMGTMHGKNTTTVVAEFKREVLTLMACGECPFLLEFYGICVDSQSRLCIVTKLMRGGNLHNFLQGRGGKKLLLREFFAFAIDIAAGMKFLHKNGIIHRDLKSANVLLDGEGHAVVGDFGVAKLKGERGEMTKEVGTYRWMAPEAFGTSAWPVTSKADVYSFGIILWEMVSLSLPYANYTPMQAAVAVTLNGLRPTIPEDCPQQIKNLIEICWAKNPDDRPNFAAVLSSLHHMMTQVALN